MSNRGLLLRYSLPRLRRKLVAVALLSISIAQAQVPSRDTSMRVQVNDIDARALVFAVAHGMHVNVLVDPFLVDRRVDASDTHHSVSEFFEAIARTTGGTLSKAGDMTVIGGGCHGRPQIPDGHARQSPSADQRLSVYVQDIELGSLFRGLGLSMAGEKSQESERLLRRSITIRAKDVPRTELVVAIARASSLQVSVLKPDELELVSSRCHSEPTPPSSRKRQRPPYVERVDHCPYRNKSGDGSQRKCESLEFFELSALRPLGFVQVNGVFSAFVETPDHAVYTVRVGNLMGRHDGRIDSVSDEVIRITEVDFDADGKPRERASVLKYGAKPPRHAVISSSPLEIGSPQFRYDESLGNLVAASNFPAAINEVCRRHHPSTADAAEKSLATWQDSHSKLLVEIQRHVSAYLQRRAEDAGVAAEVMSRKHRATLADSVNSFVRTLGGISSDRMQTYCGSLPSILRSVRWQLEQTEAGSLRVIRSCSADSTCWNLAAD